MNTKDIPQEWIRDYIEEKLWETLSFIDGSPQYEERKRSAHYVKLLLTEWRKSSD